MIFDGHSGVAADLSLLGYYAILFGKQLPMSKE
jgi:hypothetical protein